LPVSVFDPLPVEIFVGFVGPGLLEGAFRLGAAMGKAAGRGRLLGLTPLGPFTRGSQIDDIAHATLGSNRFGPLV
jgi:hypothetical protein